MKIEAKEIHEDSIQKYPYFGKSNGYKAVVLFFKDSTGVVVEKGGGDDPVNHFYDDWYEPHFTPVRYSAIFTSD